MFWLKIKQSNYYILINSLFFIKKPFITTFHSRNLSYHLHPLIISNITYSLFYIIDNSFINPFENLQNFHYFKRTLKLDNKFDLYIYTEQYMDSIKSNWFEINKRVEALSKVYSKNLSPLVLAVSKFHSFEHIKIAYDVGIRHFGENYVQELVDKSVSLPFDIKWHFIGHLQTNKCKLLISKCPNLYMVESLDSKRLASKLNEALDEVERNEKLKILIQVKTSQDSENKTGLENNLEIILDLIKFINEFCLNLEFSGLMTVGDTNKKKAEEGFEQLALLRDEILTQNPDCLSKFNDQTFHLSMGMSGDLEPAIAKGSTEIRLGTAIFGERKKK